MFTGIIEGIGKVEKIKKEKSNLLITINSPFTDPLEINQSICHNGICLSVNQVRKNDYTVCAIQETLQKTNLKNIAEGDWVNLERCVMVGDRWDGHIVQGHIDCTAKCMDIKNQDGSWEFIFKYPKKHMHYLVSKGSVCINGASLTITNIDDINTLFSVCIIPYTFEKTNFQKITPTDIVNVEFDIVAKQIARLNQVSIDVRR
tara:strand:+ start:336 stop:944 length:609 start_codon:yes stop_codon:yes gene_type:complete